MKTLHPNNKHNNGYDFSLLEKVYPEITNFLIEKHQHTTIDFSDPAAVKALNTALLAGYYSVEWWKFPDGHLCPPIPGRVDYIHHLHDLIPKQDKVTVLDIGTGATCIYPLLGNAVYDWHFVATDIDPKSLASAQKIVRHNNLEDSIEFRYQKDETSILKNIIQPEDVFSVTMCNPPFYKSEEEARGANRRKSRNLNNNPVRNFSGNSNELWYKGGEKAFLHTYLYESSLLPNASIWFTSLVSKKENVTSLQASAKKLGVKEFRIIPLQQGNKVTRIVCWQFP